MYITCERLLQSNELAHFKVGNQLNSYIEFLSRIFILLLSGLVVKEFFSLLGFLVSALLEALLYWKEAACFLSKFFRVFGDTKKYVYLNPFVPNAPFLYPLKTSEDFMIFWCFQRVEKRCIGNVWVKGRYLYITSLHPCQTSVSFL